MKINKFLKQQSRFRLAVIIFITLAIFGVAKYINNENKTEVRKEQASLSPTQIVPNVVVEESNIPGWKRYINRRFKYRIDIPGNWSTELNEQFNVFSPGDRSDPHEVSPLAPPIVAVSSPRLLKDYYKDLGKKYEPGNLDALEEISLKGNEWYIDTHSSKHILIDNHKTLIVTNKTKPKDQITPPGATEVSEEKVVKRLYITINNGNILEVVSDWELARSDVEPIFDKIISTIRILE